MKHFVAHNVIERVFGALKLTGPFFSVLSVQNIVSYYYYCMCLFAQSNQKKMNRDPYDAVYDNQAGRSTINLDSNLIDTCEPSGEWIEK